MKIAPGFQGRIFRRFALLIVAFIFCINPSLLRAQFASETLDDCITTDGTVYAMTETNNVLYIGGLFSLVGTYSGGGVPVSPSTGQAESDYPKFNGYVTVAISDGQDGCYVGGSFTRVGNYRRTNIVHILNNRTVDANWNPKAAGNWVGCMTLVSNVLYFGGNFTNVDGQIRNRLAAVDAATGNVNNWNPDANNSVYGIGVYGTNVYIGGDFTAIGGQTRNYLAAVALTNGSVTAWNPNCSDRLQALQIANDRLFIGGYFASVGGQTRPRAASFALPAQTLEAWSPNVGNGGSGYIFSLGVSGSTVFLGGSFSSIGTSTRVNVAAVDATSGLATAWDAQLDSFLASQVSDLEVISNTVYIGGLFNTAGGQKRYGAAALDRDTAIATAWNPKVNFSASSFCTISNGMFLGGTFSCVAGVERTNLAAFNLTTRQVTAWNPSASTNVLALQPYADKMFIGGEFRTINGITRSNLASVDLNTGAVSSWTPNPNLYVTSLALHNNQLYAGGAFTNVFGVGRTNLAEFNLPLGNISTWDPALNRAFVRTLTVNNNILYAGGLITTAMGQARKRVAAFDLSSGVPSLMTWDPNITNGGASIVESVVPAGDRVYISGRFTSVGTSPRTNIVCVDATTAEVLPFSNATDLSIYTMAVVSNSVFVGGDFNQIGNKSQTYMASLDATTGTTSSWNPKPSAFVRKMLLLNNVLYVGGAFYFPNTGRGLAAYPIAMSTPNVDATSITKLPNGGAQFGINAPGAVRATVSASSGLTTWESLLSLPLTNGMGTFFDSSAAAYSNRFYRVTVP